MKYYILNNAVSITKYGVGMYPWTRRVVDDWLTLRYQLVVA